MIFAGIHGVNTTTVACFRLPMLMESLKLDFGRDVDSALPLANMSRSQTPDGLVKSLDL